MQIDYQRCYHTLNLERGDDWDAAQQSYRRLVHEWHPDRHTATLAGSQRAQSYFIELTSSFNAIRRYHRRYKRMPLLAGTGTAHTTINKPFSNSESLLNRARNKEMKQHAASRDHIKRTAILMLGAGFCISVLVFLFSLDKQLAAQASDQAKRELENSKPSHFQRSFDEISRAEAKGAFIEYDPAGGALGQDSGALFKQE